MEESSYLKKIFSGAVIILIGTFISKFLSYGYRVLVGRIGTEEYGLLSLGLAISGSLIVISTLGLNIGVQRYVSYYKGKLDDARIKGIITSSLKILLPLSLSFGLILFILSDIISIQFFHNTDLSPILRILAISIPLSLPENSIFTPLTSLFCITLSIFFFKTCLKGILFSILVAAI